MVQLYCIKKSEKKKFPLFRTTWVDYNSKKYIFIFFKSDKKRVLNEIKVMRLT